MIYKLDFKDITPIELEKERKKWENDCFGGCTRKIVLESIENNVMYFIRSEYWEENNIEDEYI